MDVAHVETAADPDALRDRLPDPPGDWTRTDDASATVEYRLPSDESPCTAAKLTVRPDVLGTGAVRLDRTVDCRAVGTNRIDTVDEAVDVAEDQVEAADAATEAASDVNTSED